MKNNENNEEIKKHYKRMLGTLIAMTPTFALILCSHFI